MDGVCQLLLREEDKVQVQEESKIFSVDEVVDEVVV